MKAFTTLLASLFCLGAAALPQPEFGAEPQVMVGRRLIEDGMTKEEFEKRQNRPSHPYLNGVNLGAWFIVEKWMTPWLFTGNQANAVDQYTFDQTVNASAVLQQHWSTYITQQDFTTIKSWGFNAVRIPIGYWAYNNTGTPYISGADAYLQQALQWAKSAGLVVWIDVHGSPGSQNGFDNSGQQGAVNWQSGDNLQRTINVLTQVATKYGTLSYGSIVAGIEMTNEPISWGANNFTVTQQWTVQAYAAVKNAATNTALIVIMHDSFQPTTYWKSYVQQIYNTTAGGYSGSGAFEFDTHLYQLYTDTDNSYNQDQHVQKACAWGPQWLQLAQASPNPPAVPIYVGEWSAATNVCVYQNGTTVAGTSTSSQCPDGSCQCLADTDPSNFNNVTLSQVKRFVNAQLQTFKQYGNGQFMWSYKGPGLWSAANGIAQGWLPNPITSFATGNC